MLATGEFRPPSAEAKVVCVFCFRYDAHLVPSLLANIEPMVHGWVSWDDRNAVETLTSEPARRAALLSAARGMGAQWILAADPDERYERKLAHRMPELTKAADVAWDFACREMFSPTEFRIDGLWGEKRRTRLFPCRPDLAPSPNALHGQWFDDRSKPLQRRFSDLEFYHLRSISPTRRRHRRDLYAAADPERRYQTIGYDYLDDERAMQLVEVSPERGFDPPHIEDHALWSPPVAPGRDAPPDPVCCRLRFIERVSASWPEVAMHAAEDLANLQPDDAAMLLVAADCARAAGLVDETHRLYEVAANRGGGAAAHLGLSRVAAERRDLVTAHRAAAQALEIAPNSRLLHRQFQRTRPAPERYDGIDAPWRHWVEGSASCEEGGEMSACTAIAVIVLGYRAPEDLRGAVESVLAQSLPAEIVVVNSGGGDVRKVLGSLRRFVRLIDVEDRLFVGAARNIGIDASEAKYVAFLAADCRADPHWIARRLSAHEAGAEAVASNVLPIAHGSLIPHIASTAASAIVHWRRWPGHPELVAFGLSYDRRIFERVGYFPPHVRVSEDAILNSRLNGVRTVLPPGIVTRHRYPETISALYSDMADRGRRMARLHPFPNLSQRPSEARTTWLDTHFDRWEAASVAAAMRHPEAGWIGRRIAARLIPSALRVKRASIEAELVKLGEALPNRSGQNEQEQIGRRRTMLEAAVLSAPHLSHLHLQLGYIRREMGEVDAALDAFRASAGLSPDLEEPISALCETLAVNQRFEELLQTSEDFAILSPQFVSPWLHGLGAALELEEVGQADLLGQGALQSGVATPAVYLQRARVHRRLGRHDAHFRDKEVSDALRRQRKITV